MSTRPGAIAFKRGHGGGGEDPRADEVDVEEFAPNSRGRAGEVGVVDDATDAGVVHQNIELPVVLETPIDQLCRLVWIREIGL